LALAIAASAGAEARMLSPRYAHTATLLEDGRVLIYGGLGPRDWFVGGTEIYDPIAGRFAPGPPVHKDRAFHTATRLNDGTVLIAGGFVRPYTSSRTAELFDGRRFVFLSHMPVPRELHAATLLEDGRVLITGGFVGGITSLPHCDLFDPARRRFEPTGELHRNRFGHAACRLRDGRVLVTGGSRFPGDATHDSAEVYDPATGRFGPAGRMLAERSRHTATVLRDGRVLITGGNSIAAGGQLASTELFDPATGAFTPGPDMCDPRMDHTATLLADGRVLITGGFNAEGRPHTVDSCEVFDPEDGSLSPTSRLHAAVHEHKATLLSSGAALVSGGLEIEGERRGFVADVAVIEP
jgi:deoxycytidylate deaminase